MKRQIVAPAALSPAALAELKQWLGITTTADDAPLAALLRAALETCESFTGTMPLVAECEEVLPVRPGWQALLTRPVQAITQVTGIAPEGTALALASDAYGIELDADGGGRVRVTAPGAASRSTPWRRPSGNASQLAARPAAKRTAIRLAAPGAVTRTRPPPSASSSIP